MSWRECREQQRIATILQHSIQHDRVAHAYLFTGGQGVGKMQLATQLAKSLLCVTQTGDSCDRCHHCQRIHSRNHPDVHWIMPDGTTIKIDQVRNLQKEFAFRAVESDRKVYIIQHAEKMTIQAANSLLKFLEEPKGEVTAILLTENPHQILPTIHSRCQTMVFNELSFTSRVSKLKEQGLYEPLLRNACQITADLEHARELCQSEWFAQYRNLVLQLSEEILNKGSYALVTVQEKVLKLEQGNQGLIIFLDLLLFWYRDVLFYQMNRQEDLTNIDQIEMMRTQALSCSKAWLVEAMEGALDAKTRISRHINPQLTFERMIFRLQEV